MEKLIITAAVTGSVATRKENPNIPYSPSEIAEEVLRSYDAGSSIAHIHVRDPETGAASFELDYFQEIRDRVRSRCNIVLNFTTSGLNIKGDKVMEQRLGTTTLGPEICTLDVGSVNLMNRVFINPPEWGPYGAKVARERGVKPEIECFDAGHVRIGVNLVKQGLIDPPYLFQLCMGVGGGGIDASPKNLLFMTELLPFRDAVWTGMGIGRHEFTMAAISIISGGHCRVGFEDNIYLSKGVLAKSNAELVEKVVRLAKEFGRDIAQPDDARKILGIEENAVR